MSGPVEDVKRPFHQLGHILPHRSLHRLCLCSHSSERSTCLLFCSKVFRPTLGEHIQIPSLVYQEWPLHCRLYRFYIITYEMSTANCSSHFVTDDHSNQLPPHWTSPLQTNLLSFLLSLFSWLLTYSHVWHVYVRTRWQAHLHVLALFLVRLSLPMSTLQPWKTFFFYSTIGLSLILLPIFRALLMMVLRVNVKRQEWANIGKEKAYKLMNAPFDCN